MMVRRKGSHGGHRDQSHGGPPRLHGSHHEAPQALFQTNDIEVHQQSYFATTQAKVGQKLRFVYALNVLNRLDFNDELISDNDIRPKSSFQFIPSIDNGYRKLTREGKARLGELEAQAFLVNRFQEAWSELSVDVDCHTDHPLHQFAQHQHNVTSEELRGFDLRVLREEP